MFPSPAQLSEIAGQPTVLFAETPFPWLLVAHQAAESSGLMVARRGPIEKRVVLDRGVPVECRSNLAHETLSRFLAAIGRLTDEEANAALSKSLAQGVLLGEILLAEGKMDAGELQRLLQQSLARKLFDLFTWRDGEVTFESGEFTTPAALKVKVARLVLTGIERFVPQETIDRAIAPHAGALFARHPEAAARAEELRPSAREKALLTALDPPRRIEELLTHTGVPLDDLARELWGMALLGLVVPADRLPGLAREGSVGTEPTGLPARNEEPEVPEAVEFVPPTLSIPQLAPITPIAPTAPVDTTPSAPPAPRSAPESSETSWIDLAATSEMTSEEAARIRQEVATAFARMRDQDPFELLAADDIKSIDDLRARYFVFARRFAPWRFEAPALQSAESAAEELFAAGAIAFARLSDAKECEAIRAERLRRAQAPAGTSPTPPAPARPPAALPAPATTPRAAPASFRIETDLLDPELQYKKGRALKDAQRWSQALQQFDFAADCDPQNGAYRAEAAHCRYLLAPNTMAVKALDELKAAQRIDPESITPYLYAGEIAASLGQFEEAESNLRAAARRLGSHDRRALDALRDLAKKRKK
ncbi:MAG: DUF4388 domain-containing protein [Thermoanaerobaculia bacterium]